MSDLGNKGIFAENLTRYVERSGKTQKEIAEYLGVPYSTFNEWTKGKKYPRMDKVEMLANYFSILKSDLIEKKTEEHRKMQQINSVLADLTIRMRTDNDFFSVVEGLNQLDTVQLASVKQIVETFLIK